jgi:hypothetical protein
MDTCVPNIGPRQRRLRLTAGVVVLAATALFVGIQLTQDMPRVWRLLAFPPLLFGLLLVLQAHAHTCVALAARGERNLDQGVERLAADQMSAVKHQASRVTGQSVAVAMAVTLLLLVLT